MLLLGMLEEPEAELVWVRVGEHEVGLDSPLPYGRLKGQDQRKLLHPFVEVYEHVLLRVHFGFAMGEVIHMGQHHRLRVVVGEWEEERMKLKLEDEEEMHGNAELSPLELFPLHSEVAVVYRTVRGLRLLRRMV